MYSFERQRAGRWVEDVTQILDQTTHTRSAECSAVEPSRGTREREFPEEGVWGARAAIKREAYSPDLVSRGKGCRMQWRSEGVVEVVRGSIGVCGPCKQWHPSI